MGKTRGAKPKPHELKVIAGTARKDRTNEDAPDPEFDNIHPTRKLTEAERECWDEIVPELARNRIVRNTDCVALTMLVEAYSIYRQALKELEENGLVAEGSLGQTVVSPQFKNVATAMKQMQSILPEFGMTPSSRSRIIVPKKDKSKRGFDID